MGRRVIKPEERNFSPARRKEEIKQRFYALCMVDTAGTAAEIEREVSVCLICSTSAASRWMTIRGLTRWVNFDLVFSKLHKEGKVINITLDNLSVVDGHQGDCASVGVVLKEASDLLYP